jgi:hypothetical protein
VNRTERRNARRSPLARLAAVLAAVRDALAARLGATRRDYALALAALDAQRDCVALAVDRAARNAAAAREHDGARLAALAERDAAERRATEAEREAALARAEAATEREAREAAERERDNARAEAVDLRAAHKAAITGVCEGIAEAVDLRAELATERDNAACERGAREAAERRATVAEYNLGTVLRDLEAAHAARDKAEARAAALAEALTLAQGGCQ